MMLRFALCALSILFACRLLADDHVVHNFDRHQLTDVYYSEGVAVGDINGDGRMDVAHGPLWFEGPEFKSSHEIYARKAQP